MATVLIDYLLRATPMSDQGYVQAIFVRCVLGGLLLTAVAGCADSMSQAENDARASLRKLGAMTVLGADGIHVATVTMTVPSVQEKMEEAIPHVGNLPYLTHLELTGTNVTDEQMKTIGELDRLTSLVLSDTKIGDTGLKHVAGLKLDTLYVDGTQLTPDAMDIIGGLSALTILDLSGTELLSNAQPLANLKNLEWLVVEDVKLESNVVDILKELPALGRLTIKGSTIADSDLARLRSAKPSLMIDGGGSDAEPAPAEGTSEVE